MSPDSLRYQVQTVLTTNFEDIKGIQGASCCPKTKVVKRKLEDQEDTGTTPDKDAAAESALTPPPTPPPPPPRRTGVLQPPQAGWSLH